MCVCVCVLVCVRKARCEMSTYLDNKPPVFIVTDQYIMMVFVVFENTLLIGPNLKKAMTASKGNVSY